MCTNNNGPSHVNDLIIFFFLNDSQVHVENGTMAQIMTVTPQQGRLGLFVYMFCSGSIWVFIASFHSPKTCILTKCSKKITADTR